MDQFLATFFGIPVALLLGLMTAVILLAASCLYGAFMSPWWIRNAVIFHAFVPFGTNAGENLYLGNNPYNRDGGIDWATDVDPAEARELFAISDELQRQAAFAKKARTFILEHPAQALLQIK